MFLDEQLAELLGDPTWVPNEKFRPRQPSFVESIANAANDAFTQAAATNPNLFDASGAAIRGRGPGPGRPWEPTAPVAIAPSTLSVPDSQLGVGSSQPANWFSGIAETIGKNLQTGLPAPPSLPLNSMKPGAIVPSGSGTTFPSVHAEAMGPVYDQAARAEFLGGDLGKQVATMTSDEQSRAAMSLPRNPYADLMPVDAYAEPIHVLGVNGFRTGSSSPFVDYSPVMQQQNALRHNRSVLSDIMRNEVLERGQDMRERVGLANAAVRRETDQLRNDALQEAATTRGMRAIADPKLSKVAKNAIITGLELPPEIKQQMLIENQLTNPKAGGAGALAMAGVGADGSFRDVMANVGDIPLDQLRDYLGKKGITPEVAAKRLTTLANQWGRPSDQTTQENEFIKRLYGDIFVNQPRMGWLTPESKFVVR